MKQSLIESYVKTNMSQQIRGRKVYTDQSANQVFVSNLPQKGVTEEHLRKHFGQFGVVKNVRLIKNPDTNSQQDYAIIAFDNEASMEKCAQQSLQKIFGVGCTVKKIKDMIREKFCKLALSTGTTKGNMRSSLSLPPPSFFPPRVPTPQLMDVNVGKPPQHKCAYPTPPTTSFPNVEAKISLLEEIVQILSNTPPPNQVTSTVMEQASSRHVTQPLPPAPWQRKGFHLQPQVNSVYRGCMMPQPTQAVAPIPNPFLPTQPDAPIRNQFLSTPPYAPGGNAPVPTIPHPPNTNQPMSQPQMGNQALSRLPHAATGNPPLPTHPGASNWNPPLSIPPHLAIGNPFVPQMLAGNPNMKPMPQTFPPLLPSTIPPFSPMMMIPPPPPQPSAPAASSDMELNKFIQEIGASALKSLLVRKIEKGEENFIPSSMLKPEVIEEILNPSKLKGEALDKEKSSGIPEIKDVTDKKEEYSERFETKKDEQTSEKYRSQFIHRETYSETYDLTVETVEVRSRDRCESRGNEKSNGGYRNHDLNAEDEEHENLRTHPNSSRPEDRRSETKKPKEQKREEPKTEMLAEVNHYSEKIERKYTETYKTRLESYKSGRKRNSPENEPPARKLAREKRSPDNGSSPGKTSPTRGHTREKRTSNNGHSPDKRSPSGSHSSDKGHSPKCKTGTKRKSHAQNERGEKKNSKTKKCHCQKEKENTSFTERLEKAYIIEEMIEEERWMGSHQPGLHRDQPCSDECVDKTQRPTDARSMPNSSSGKTLRGILRSSANQKHVRFDLCSSRKDGNEGKRRSSPSELKKISSLASERGNECAPLQSISEKKGKLSDNEEEMNQFDSKGGWGWL